MKFLLALAVAVVLLVSDVHAAQLEVDDANPCQAKWNGTMFDISDVFEYPVAVPNNGSGYSYWFSPCPAERGGAGACPHSPDDLSVAACQKADQFYVTGQVSDALWLLQTGYAGTPVWDVYLRDGASWRVTKVRFEVDLEQHEPTIEFVSEDPYLTYNMLVKGRCIGQAYAPSDCA